MIEGYKIIHMDGSNTFALAILLEQRILKMSKEGWALQGGLSVSQGQDEDGFIQFNFWQAMVKVAKEA